MTIIARYSKRLFKAGLITTVLLSHLVSCGGSSDVADNGGIGGSGMTAGSGNGEITAFGSVIFDDSTFAVNDSTIFTVDGLTVNGQSDLGEGMIASFEIGEDAAPNLATGTAQRIDAVTALKGVVTNISPLEVLGQPVIVTADTVLDSVPGNNVANLLTTDLVEIYGIVDDNNNIRATRIEYKTLSGLVEWKLTGVASNVTATTLAIGNQIVNINGVAIDNCLGGLNAGDFVEIKANPNIGFLAGDTLNLVTKVECEFRAIPIPSNPNASVIPAQFEGVVTGYTGAGDFDFFLSEQLVEFSLATEFRGGNIDDLVDGTRLEAEGLFDTGTLVLTANEIKFRQTRVRIEAPVNPGDVIPGVSLDILGLTVFGTAATEDDDNILASANGLPGQVEVRGFVDSAGDIYAEEIRARGGVDNSDIRLRGPVANLANPNLEILGVPVNLSGAAGYFDLLGNPIVINVFFGLLNDGDIVEVEDAQLNAGPAIVMDINSTAQIED